MPVFINLKKQNTGPLDIFFIATQTFYTYTVLHHPLNTILSTAPVAATTLDTARHNNGGIQDGLGGCFTSNLVLVYTYAFIYAYIALLVYSPHLPSSTSNSYRGLIITIRIFSMFICI